jgi:hypothetical protein
MWLWSISYATIMLRNISDFSFSVMDAGPGEALSQGFTVAMLTGLNWWQSCSSAMGPAIPSLHQTYVSI